MLAQPISPPVGHRPIERTRLSRPLVVRAETVLLPAYVLVAVGLAVLIALVLMLLVSSSAPPLDDRPTPSPAPQAPPVAPLR